VLMLLEVILNFNEMISKMTQIIIVTMMMCFILNWQDVSCL